MQKLEREKGEGWGRRDRKGGGIRNLAPVVGKKWREWTMEPALDVLLGPHDKVGNILRVGVALGCNVVMNVGPELRILLVPRR